MKLLMYASAGGPRSGALLDDSIVDLVSAAAAMGADSLPPTLEELLAEGEPAMTRARAAVDWAAAGSATSANRPFTVPLEGSRLLAPIRRPEKIIGVGLNYRDHCREIAREIPTEIRTFGMFPNALIGPGDTIQLPKTSTQIDWEAELVVVIGSRAKHLSVDRALDCVAGYTVGNDVSARDHQKADPQATRGKSGDTHAPIGPWVVTRDDIPDPSRLAIELKVNGVVKQSSNTSELVFSVAEIVAFLSRYFTLTPGDLIFTGTPAGVGMGRNPAEWLRHGDRVEVTIERIGTLTNTCADEAR